MEKKDPPKAPQNPTSILKKLCPQPETQTRAQPDQSKPRPENNQNPKTPSKPDGRPGTPLVYTSPYKLYSIDENGSPTPELHHAIVHQVVMERLASQYDCRDEEETSTSQSTQSEPLSGSLSPSHLMYLADQRTDPDQPEKLLLYQGHVNGVKCRILIDGGATNNFISERFRKKVGLPTVALTRETEVSLGDGKTAAITNKVLGVDVHIDEYKAGINFCETTLNPTFDLVLGKPWLKVHNPYINWREDIISFSYRGRWHELDANQHRHKLDGGLTLPDGVELVTAMQMRKLARKERAFMAIVNPVTEENVEDNEALDTPQGSGLNSGAAEFIPTRLKPNSVDNNHTSHKLPSFFHDTLGSQEKYTATETLCALGAYQTKEPVNPPPPLYTVKSDLSPSNHAKLQILVHEYADTMPATLPNGLPPKRAVEHEIEEEPGSKPPSKAAYRMSQEEMETLRTHIADLLEKGFIRPSCSPYGAPVLFVPKKDGGFRMCVDWRQLNKQTIKNKYPLPRIDDLLERLHGSKVWSKIDLTQGYYQVRIKEDDIPKTAFRTRYGLYEFTVLGMGLCNAPATFMRVMNDALRPFLDRFVLCYLDDLLIFSDSEEEHLEHLRQVFEVLRQQKLFASPKKCEFGRTHIDFLGHSLSPEGIRPDDTKINIIKNWPKPTTCHDLRSFLGLANYYRVFIRHFAEKAGPLNTLLKQKSTCKWGPEEQIAFDTLKQALASKPIIQAPSPTAPFTVHTDASKVAIGAALMQTNDQGHEYVVAYESRKLKEAETRYAAHEREQLAVVHALRVWRHHLKGRKFTLITDSSSVKSLPTQPTLTDRQARWAEKLAEYDFDIQHRAGPKNVVPDALSRYPAHQCNNLAAHEVTPPADLHTSIRSTAAADPIYQRHKRNAQNGQSKHFSWRDNLLWYKDRLYIPDHEPLYSRVLHEAHDAQFSGHLGVDKTLARITAHFFWPRMGHTVTRYINTCATCQQVKAPNQRPMGHLQSLPIPDSRFDTWSMDFVVGLPTTQRKKNSILVMQDSITKMVLLMTCSTSITAPQVAALCFTHLVCRFGMPRVLVSDRDTKFTSHFWRCLWTLMGTKLAMSTARHPQTDGQTERTNRTVGDMLKAFAWSHPTQWDAKLPAFELAYNSSVHHTTGFAPFVLAYGQNVHTPLTLMTGQPPPPVPAVGDFVESQAANLEEAKAHIARAQVRHAKYANRHRRPGEFTEGDLVYLAVDSPKKLEPRFEGPYLILARTSELTYRLKLRDGDTRHPVFHISILRLCDDGSHEFPSRLSNESPSVIVPPDHSAHPTVEAILDHKLVQTPSGGVTTVYLVQWHDKPSYDNSWLTPATLSEQAPDLFHAYTQAYPDPSTPRPSQGPVAPDPADATQEETPRLPVFHHHQGEDFQDPTGAFHQRTHRLPPGTRSRPRR